MKSYSVKQLARLAGVSVRTLHHYDRLGLLKPLLRTEARYRRYGEKELLRLQQILLYKELDFSLSQIAQVLDHDEFDLLKALESHRIALQAKSEALARLLLTIDKTIQKLKGEKVMLTDEELYEGFPKEQGVAYRKEAVEKWGERSVEQSEQYLRSLSKPDFERLKAESAAIREALLSLMHEEPASEAVQWQIARHYTNIRQFWGTAGSPDRQAEAYKGLGQLYLSDERYTMVEGKPQPEFAAFLSQAMAHYADTQLKA